MDMSRIDRAQRLVYVEYLAVAPWNRVGPQAPELRGVGTLLARIAVRPSAALGHEGRIGLHSKPASESFYKRLGLVAVGLEVTDDGEWMYFEATPEVARGLM